MRGLGFNIVGTVKCLFGFLPLSSRSDILEIDSIAFESMRTRPAREAGVFESREVLVLGETAECAWELGRVTSASSLLPSGVIWL